MTIYFATGNEHKFDEFRAILGDVKQIDIDLPEIQETDPEAIVRDKLLRALEHLDDELIIEDTSFHMDALNGLPGPLIKWFLRTVGKEGLSDMSVKLGNDRAQARTIIGYGKSVDEIYFFEGVVHGRVVSPRGEGGFQWDKIFIPDGQEKTFAEMTSEEKNAISHRRKALDKLKEFLDKR